MLCTCVEVENFISSLARSFANEALGRNCKALSRALLDHVRGLIKELRGIF